jgi:hypothetical protein
MTTKLLEIAIIINSAKNIFWQVKNLEEKTVFYYENDLFELVIDDQQLPVVFYDWLRSKEDGILGVRLFFIEAIPNHFVNSLRSNFKIVDERQLQIFFSNNFEFVENTSDDQLLGLDRSFKSNNGIMAYTFYHEDAK